MWTLPHFNHGNKGAESGKGQPQEKDNGKEAAGKALAMLLDGSGKASYGFIARLFGVSRPAVLKWVRTFASTLPEPEINADIKKVQVDEMWHFINKKNKKYKSQVLKL
jgi:hypothetical protein